MDSTSAVLLLILLYSCGKCAVALSFLADLVELQSSYFFLFAGGIGAWSRTKDCNLLRSESSSVSECHQLTGQNYFALMMVSSSMQILSKAVLKKRFAL